jgi:hypothetical protein
VFWDSAYAIFLDVNDDFSEVLRVSLSGLTLPTTDIKPRFLAVQAPVRNYMIDQINAYRFTQPGTEIPFPYQEPYTMPLWYLGLSPDLTECARLHANWCIANSRASHEGANGTDLVHQRAAAYGFRTMATGENLAFIEVMESEVAEIDECLRLWKESPGHNDNLVNRNSTLMGYAAAAYPASCHAITVGPGLYDPVSHTYTTVETVITLHPSKYGRMKLYVYNVAEG